MREFLGPETFVQSDFGPEPFYTPTDPKFLDSQTWYLSNPGNPGLDINLEVIWDEYRGAGVTIGIIDDGVEYSHTDLAANSNPALGANLVGDGTASQQDGRAINTGDNHGTLVAGVIAADDNGSLGVGIAPDATIAGLRIGFGSSGNTQQIVDAFVAAKSFDIVNNSWGYGGYFYDNLNDHDSFGAPWSNPFIAVSNALIEAIDQGRDGLGTIFTFAAGNSGGNGQDVNYHGLQSSPFTITVGGYNQYDNYYSASTPGAAVLVAGPAQNVRSTDRTGTLGFNSTDTASVTGTSFASPAVAAVVALMLEANAELGYRDVQEILTLSSELVDANGGGWEINGSTNWNGGGQHFSNILGFGSVDAYNAVRLAETWDKQSTYSNLATATVAGSVSNGALGQNTIVEHLTVGDLGIDLDQVVLNLDLTHTFIGDLVITLESPDGTLSTLMNRPGNGAGLQSTFIDQFELSSVQYWGEDLAGDWTLTVQDAGTVGAGTLNGWSLTFLGDADVGDDVYVYTAEWATYGAEAGRQILADDAGADTINMAAIADAVTLDLHAGVSNTLLGHSLTIAAGTIIENAVTGDGDDIIVGNGADNWLRGMRGDDTFTGGDGDDAIDGGAGVDTAVFSAAYADYTATIDANGVVLVVDNVGSDGTDTLTGIEFLSFSDQLIAVDGFTEVVDPPTDPVDPPPTDPVDPPPTDPVDPPPSVGENAPDATPPAATVSGTSSGYETLNGTAGNDVIDAGGGKYDVLNGGLGDDVYIINNSSTTINDDGGNDTLYSSALFYAAQAEMETAYMAGGAVELRMNAGDNVVHGTDNDNIIRGGVGNDQLYGYQGNDKLYGEDGDDLLNGGGGADQAVYKGFSYNYGIVFNSDGTVTVTDNNGSDGVDQLVNIEEIVFNDQTIVVPTDPVDPPPTDPVDPPPTDPVDPPPTDPVDPPPTDPVDPPPTDPDGNAPDATPPAATVMGTANAREILDGTTGDDVIDGGGGKYDVLNGGLGNDTYIVTNNSIIINDGVGEGNDTLYSSATFYAASAEIETLYMFGNAQELRANVGDNVIHGTDDNNIIRGGEGNDQLFGYYGDDTLYGEFGDDLLYGGQGQDTAAYKSNYANYSIVQNADGSVTVTDNANFDGVDTLVNIELISFTDATIDLSVLFG